MRKMNMGSTIFSTDHSSVKSETTRLFFFIAFAFLLPISQDYSTGVLLIWLTYSLFVFDKKQVSGDLRLWVPVGLLIVYGISLLVSENANFHFLERKSSLLAFRLCLH